MAKKKVPKKQKKATIYGLADITGASLGTVSRVLNNRDNVHSQTRARILELARRIRIKPQVSARNKEIAVVTAPHYTYRFRGYTSMLTSHVAFALSECNVGMLVPSNPLKQLKNYFIDGVIAITYANEIYDMLCELEKQIPIVYFDHFAAKKNQYIVCSDHYDSGYRIASYFIEHGRTRLGFIGGDAIPFQERLRGYLNAIKDAGIKRYERLQVLMPQGESLYLVVSRTVKNKADAIFVPGCSMQVIEALHILTNVMGLRVPEDISIIGGENTGVSMFQQPPLTCISEPLEDMANAAVEMVLELADGNRPSKKQQILPVELIERESVA